MLAMLQQLAFVVLTTQSLMAGTQSQNTTGSAGADTRWRDWWHEPMGC